LKDYSFEVGQKARDRLRLLDRVHGPYSRKMVTDFLPMTELNHEATIVDAGGGTGEMLPFLSKTFCQVTCIDNNEEQLTLAKHLCKANQIPTDNVIFKCEDVMTCEDILAADLIYARFILHHLSSPLKFLQRIKKNKQQQYCIIEEVDHTSWDSIPANEAVYQAREMFVGFGNLKHKDYMLGQHIVELIHSIGLTIHAVEFSQPARVNHDTSMLHDVVDECKKELGDVYGEKTIKQLLTKLKHAFIDYKNTILVYPKITHLLISNV